MIHLDTNFLISALVSGSAQEAQLVSWLSDGEEIGISAVAWGEFLCGPLSPAAESLARRLLPSAEALERSDEFEQRRVALVECLAKLRPKDRDLIEQRYAPGERGKRLAEQLGRPANSVYQTLGRIRRVLMECIQRRMTEETTK